MSFWSPKTGFTVPHKKETERQAHYGKRAGYDRSLLVAGAYISENGLIAELDRAARKEGYGIVVFNCSMDYY